MKIKIYQISKAKDARGLMFCRHSFVQLRGGVRPYEYELTFEGDVPALDLDDVYLLFNSYLGLKRPAGFCGRSLSVSDVVVTDDGAFFCDSFGWVKLSSSEWHREEG